MNSTLKQRTPVRRRRLGKPRRGPLRDAEYMRWVARFVCCTCAVIYDVSAVRTIQLVLPTSDPAHTKNNGMSSKGPDSSCVPLCRRHHREYDAGRKKFETKYSVDMKAIAAQYWAEFNREMGLNLKTRFTENDGGYVL